MSETRHAAGTTAAGQPWLSLVGLGEDGLDGLTPAARQALDAATTVFGGDRHLGLIPARSGQTHIPWPSPLTRALPWIEACRGQPVCVLASGDPFWYGIGSTLAHRLPPAEMAVHPAPSAFSLAAARLGWPLQNCHCLSVHGRPLERVQPWLQAGARLLILSWDGTTPAALAAQLAARGFGRSHMAVLAHLGGDREQRHSARAADWDTAEVANLNTIAVTCEPDAPGAGIAATPGRPDDAFAHDGAITRREVRAVTLAHLAPRPGETLWDIGAGSGTVSIEWLLAHSANHAVAVEPRPERAARIAENARAFGVPHLTCIEGHAPAALADQPAPDAVFIGGGLTTPDLIEHCRAALAPGGRLVANSVTLEGDAVLTDARARWGGELLRLHTERAEPLGRLHGFTPARTITLWVCR